MDERADAVAWPTKPKGMDEHTWFREIEKQIVLTVVSADPEDSACPRCGERRIIYQHQDLKTRQIHALCKDCTLAKAGSAELLWVRTGSLRETWATDGRNARRRTTRKRPLANPVEG